MTEMNSNTIEGYLNYCIKMYYSDLLTKYNFKLVTKHIEEMGGLYQYENGYLSFQIINDRGVVDGMLAPMHSSGKFYDLGLLYGFVCIKQNPDCNPMDKQLALKKNLSCAEESAFVDANYNLLLDMFSAEKFSETQSELKIVSSERAAFLFGNS